MGKIKRVRFLRRRKLGHQDSFDRVFWNEFFRLESFSGDNKQGGQVSPNERLVTVTIKDEDTGEEWVIERVRLTKENVRKIGD